MLYTPILVECSNNIAFDYLVAYKTLMAKDLIIMVLAVGQTLPFIMSFTKKRSLAFGACKVLNVEMFP